MQKLLSCNSTTLFTTYIRHSPCCRQLEFVRYRRPIWAPLSKKRIFLVPIKYIPPLDEDAEAQNLFARYQLKIRSLIAFETKKAELKRAHEESLETHLQYEAEIDKLIEENEKVNALVSQERDKRAKEEWIKMENEILAKRLELEQKEEEQLKLTEQEITDNLERLKTAIKLEDLDEAIEKALNTVTDYNFAIDKNGNRYYGRHNNTVPRKPDSTGEESTMYQ